MVVQEVGLPNSTLFSAIVCCPIAVVDGLIPCMCTVHFAWVEQMIRKCGLSTWISDPLYGTFSVVSETNPSVL